MKKILLTSLIATSLIACGGDDSSSSKTVAKIDSTLLAQLPAEIKGSPIEPDLSTATVTESDALTVNSKSTGEVSADSHINLNFTAEQSGPLLAVLSSSSGNTKDLDFEINDNTNSKYYDSSGNNSDEAIFFEAVAGSQYTIAIYGEFEVGTATFELKLVDANRASLNLADSEYGVFTQETTNESCAETVNGGSPTTETYNYTEDDFSIYNWKDGYIKSYGGSEKHSFSSVNGNAVTVKFSDTDSYSEGNVTFNNKFQLTAVLTTDFKTGNVTGTSSYSSTETSSDNSYSESCTGNDSITGKIVL